MRKHFSLRLMTIICVLAVFACSGPSGPADDFPVTETAIASTVMTQLAVPSAVNPEADAVEPTPLPSTDIPQFNPFANLTAEQESCLKQAWGDENFTAISNFQRPPTQEEKAAISACDLPKPADGAGGLNQPGGQPSASKDQTYFTTSNDGLTWSEGTLLAEQASVPEVIYTSKGEYWAYWVDFSNASGPNTEKVGIAHSVNGSDWQMMGNVQFTDIGSITPVDPDVVELPDGRLRLYFFDIAGQGAHSIHSAISSDGINFTLESGTRFIQDDIYDPNVVLLPDGSYRMYLNSQDIISATSADGLTFTADEGVRVENGAVPGAIVLPDGSVRVYACTQGISVYKSVDGLNFTLEKQGVIPAKQGGILCDPAVTATPNGFMMVYKYNSGQP